MVSPATLPAAATTGDIGALVADLDPADRELVGRAAGAARTLYGDTQLGTGEAAWEHALGLTGNLAMLRADAATRAAGLLFAAPNHLRDARERLAREFGPTVGSLVLGISTVNKLRVVTRSLATDAPAPGVRDPDRRTQVETLRKMLLAMVEDIRVVLIRLASRTQTLRFLTKADSPQREALARETLDIYAPLANRLGVWQLKWEMEDLSLRILEPATYTRIAKALDERRLSREAFIADATAALAAALSAAGLDAEVTGRPKHIYSIHNKMRQKHLAFEQVNDIRGLRVLVPTVEDCYTALGVVHDLWKPIAAEFDDYIARPKPNGYRSLHTAVTGPDGRPLEVQIRTPEMHQAAELGVAAHWRYKEGSSGPAEADGRIAWLREMLAWRDEVVAGSDWQEASKQAARDDTVYILTPQGRVVDLPKGATPIDFAYALHSDIGHRCRGAKVDGAMVPLDFQLQNGQRVEIITTKAGGPSRDWLTQPGFLASHRARSKVRQYFVAEERARTVAAGRATVEREIQREGAGRVGLEELARSFGCADTEEFFAAVGRETIGAKALQQALRGPAEAPAEAPAVVPRKSQAAGPAEGVLFVGVDRLMTQLAGCCKPLPPDPITGFVTRGKGISVHRQDCRSLAQLVHRHPERAIEAEWGARATGVYSADIHVEAHDRQGLLRDVSDVLSRERINVTAVNTQSRQHVAQMAFTVEVTDLDQLHRTLQLIREVRGVITARRR
ncbi:MAG: bifunctional (p)ppGpp synthetase/guanosine-3',5'-bis(diphosphate) 3'-pyrophosphohydrolase [Chromatiales bacterium]|jgi:GTP pyrophosphokinase|nr:bifunctional (p)ppGpp synthetase/guanosine-3',5'-bis(diphosphate) 3'-pyrophosphohydrolase [Chromatiales bacterium]